jgi:hypothetical protein
MGCKGSCGSYCPIFGGYWIYLYFYSGLIIDILSTVISEVLNVIESQSNCLGFYFLERFLNPSYFSPIQGNLYGSAEKIFG